MLSTQWNSITRYSHGLRNVGRMATGKVTGAINLHPGIPNAGWLYVRLVENYAEKTPLTHPGRKYNPFAAVIRLGMQPFVLASSWYISQTVFTTVARTLDTRVRSFESIIRSTDSLDWFGVKFFNGFWHLLIVWISGFSIHGESECRIVVEATGFVW